MSHKNQWNGPNGSYDICSVCGHKYGSPPDGAIGMWGGTCDICGREGYLSNALHDWDMDSATCLRAREEEMRYRDDL